PPAPPRARPRSAPPPATAPPDADPGRGAAAKRATDAPGRPTGLSPRHPPWATPGAGRGEPGAVPSPGMNAEHLRFCASAEWAETVERVLLPWAIGGRRLDDQVLEVGAGPG